MNLREDGIYCDCTVGGGGHLLAMLKKIQKARFIGIDIDQEAIAYTQKVISEYKKRVFLVEDNFTNLDLVLNRLGVLGVDGFLFDLGPSYHQLTTPGRGFGFREDGPLLMRMSPKITPLYERLRTTTKDELAWILKNYGDVRYSYPLAQLIYEKRKELKTTSDLVKLLNLRIPQKVLVKNLHKIFQALRIWVNGELENLKIGLKKAVEFLKPQGRLLVISYHSGEDRITKTFFLESERLKILKRLNKKVIRPQPAEIEKNPSCRSARMRIGEKCG